jgi:anion-transporting  ArsA/GET3 family ATPase
MADALSGTQEYMAAEKLYELAEDGRFDLVIVDTPPTRNALDFIDAPTTLTRFLDHRLYRLLMAPTRRMTRAVGFATSAFIRTVSKVAGSAVVEDAIEFFSAFDGLEAGFRERAHQVADRFRSPATAFVLVTSPRREALDEARWFADRLDEDGIGIRGVVVNRVLPRPMEGPSDPFVELVHQHPGTDLAALAAPSSNSAGRPMPSATGWPACSTRSARCRWCSSRSSTATCATSTVSVAIADALTPADRAS